MDLLGRHVGFLDQLRVRLSGCERTLQCFGMELTAGIDALAEPDDLQPPPQIFQSPRAVWFGNKEADGIGSTVDRSDSGHDT
jgi:hypothetical protein